MSSPLVTLVATYDKANGRGTTNAGRYSNPKMDALLIEAMRTIDDAKRAELLRRRRPSCSTITASCRCISR